MTAVELERAWPDLTDLPADLTDRRSSGWWGMVGLVATEATVFGALIAAYLYLRLNADQWPLPPIEVPELALLAIGTVLLLISTATLFAAERAHRSQRVDRAWVLTALTAILGAAFLVVQAFEFSHRSYGVGTNAYGTVTYTITSLHGAHVVVGLILLTYLLVRLRRSPERSAELVAPVSLYWHFVDAVWVVVFSTLYLSEHL